MLCQPKLYICASCIGELCLAADRPCALVFLLTLSTEKVTGLIWQKPIWKTWQGSNAVHSSSSEHVKLSVDFISQVAPICIQVSVERCMCVWLAYLPEHVSPCVPSDYTSCLRLASCVCRRWTSTTRLPSRNSTTFTAAVNLSSTGEGNESSRKLLFFFIWRVKLCCIWSKMVITCHFVSASLKRTTDIMFGGKQVVVCGYGEVNHSFIKKNKPPFRWNEFIESSRPFQCTVLWSLGGERLLHCSQSSRSHCVHHRNWPHLCSAGMVSCCSLPFNTAHLCLVSCHVK